MDDLFLLLLIIGFAVLLGIYVNQIKTIKQNERMIDLLEVIEIILQRQDKK